MSGCKQEVCYCCRSTSVLFLVEVQLLPAEVRVLLQLFLAVLPSLHTREGGFMSKNLFLLA